MAVQTAATRLNGRRYRLRTDGGRDYGLSVRSSQRGDPGRQEVATWRVDGPAFTSDEDTSAGNGYLGIDSNINSDSRWPDLLTLGPKINTVTLSTHEVTWTNSKIGTNTFTAGVGMRYGASPIVGNASGMAVIRAFGSTYGYVNRKGIPAKIDLADMTLKQSQLALKGLGTSITTTRSANGTVEVVFGEEGSAYETLNSADVAVPPNTDIVAVNDANQYARIVDSATDRVVGLYDHVARGNVLTGSVTMQSPNWNTIATLAGVDPLKFTGFALDGSLWVIGTSNGPYMLDRAQAEFFPLIPEIDNDEVNSVGMTTWYPREMGVIIPLRGGTRRQRGGSGDSWGVETFHRNTGEVQGRGLGHAGNERWLYQTIYDDENDNSYLVAWRPRMAGDPHPNVMQPFPIAKFSGIKSEFLEWLGTVNGVRTNGTLAGGSDDDMFWIIEGRTSRFIDDANYAYATSGSADLTELRRDRGLVKDFEYVELETASCTQNRTVALSFSVDGASAKTVDGSLSYGGSFDSTSGSADTRNGTIKSNGSQRIMLIDDGERPLDWASGYRIKPTVTLASNVSTAAPQILGEMRMYYRIRPKTIREWSNVTFDLTDQPDATAREQMEQLTDLVGAGPMRWETPDRDIIYVRVESVQAGEVTQKTRAAELRLVEWSVR